MKSESLNKKAQAILSRFSIKKTPLRIHLVELFLKEKKSMSQGELLEKLSEKMDSADRVSIYRNLTQLKASGIVHEIEKNHYVACSHDCEKHAHVLLYCQNCGKHKEVIDHEKLRQFFQGLDGLHFLSPKKALFVKGVCQHCAKTT